MLAASQTKDKTVLTEEGVERVLNELKEICDFVICDSPAGIESGSQFLFIFIYILLLFIVLLIII